MSQFIAEEERLLEDGMSLARVSTIEIRENGFDRQSRTMKWSFGKDGTRGIAAPRPTVEITWLRKAWIRRFIPLYDPWDLSGAHPPSFKEPF